MRLVLVGAGYEDNLAIPHNVAGRAMLRELANLDHAANHAVEELRTDRAWDRGLESLVEPTIVVVLAAHGGADGRGAYLLPHDADTEDAEGNRVRVEKVLDRLSRLPASKNKVLILDATQFTAHWPLGMLANTFAPALQQMEDRILQIPNLVVLSSSGSEQRSWTNPEWGTTVFGHYLIEGMRGEAEADGNAGITALELYSYLQRQVAGWARHNRGAWQTPVLLPLGAAGEKRAMAITVSRSRPGHAPAVANAKGGFTAPPQLRAAWEHFHQLQAVVPSPAVQFPHVWRMYQAALLRYEQLLQYGAEEAAARLQQRLVELEEQMRQPSAVSFRSLDNTLTMPALAGVETRPAAAAVPEVDRLLKELWEAPSVAEAQQKWKMWTQKEAEAKAPLPVRRDLTGLLLERIASDPESLGRAASLLRLLRAADVPPPAEAHFAVMLARDLPDGTTTEHAQVVALAVRVRLLAERAATSLRPGVHAYTEAIHPWIETQLLAADEQRQLGQDLLFSSAPADWHKSRELLQAAQACYERVQHHAEQVRQALAIRDSVSARLPAYSHWAAGHPRRSAIDTSNLEPEVAQAWQDLHRLYQLLESPAVQLLHEPIPAGASPPPDSLVAQAQRVATTFGQVEQRFEHVVEALTAARTLTPTEALSVWLDTESVLALPFVDPARRMSLLNRQHELSLRLAQDGSSSPSLAEDDSASKLFRRQARREGDMALAVLGQQWFDQLAEPLQENQLQTRHRLEVFGVEEKWWQSLALAGQRIGQQFQRMPVAIKRLRAPEPRADLAQYRHAMLEADGLVRLLEPALTLPRGFDPAGECRRLQRAEFFLGQARRTLADHWFDESPTAEPYFRAAGRLFLADARSQLLATSGGRVAVNSPATVALFAGLDHRLNLPGELIVVDAATQVPILTSEQQFERQYRLVPSTKDDWLPAGNPVLWLQSSSGLRLWSLWSGNA